MDGLRKCLVDEFSSLYVLHLRGNQRTSGELSRREGGKVFGSGSRAPIAITLFVKNPEAIEHGRIFFHDIGDYLTRDKKLAMVRDLRSVKAMGENTAWMQITPDEHHDWLNQRDPHFDKFISLGDKKDSGAINVFENFSQGVLTSRDAWCYNFSSSLLESNINNTINFYNSEAKRYGQCGKKLSPDELNKFLSTDASSISWSRGLKNNFRKGKYLEFNDGVITNSIYRPFTKQRLYFSRVLNELVYQIPKIFPTADAENLAIAASGTGAANFSCLMVDTIPSFDLVTKGQYFPLKLYETTEDADNCDLFQGSAREKCNVYDGITNEGLAHFIAAHPGREINKEDVFYYVYGLLHSKDYRARYADNLSKQIPRIPCVKSTDDFLAFVAAGRQLGHLHVNYESVEPYPVTYKEGVLELANLSGADYRVDKMRFGGKRGEIDKSTVIYNQ